MFSKSGPDHQRFLSASETAEGREIADLFIAHERVANDPKIADLAAKRSANVRKKLRRFLP